MKSFEQTLGLIAEPKVYIESSDRPKTGHCHIYIEGTSFSNPNALIAGSKVLEECDDKRVCNFGIARTIENLLMHLAVEKGFHLSVRPLSPQFKLPHVWDFSVTLIDPFGEGRVTNEKITHHHHAMRSLGLSVEKVDANDPVGQHFVLRATAELKQLLIERALCF